MNQNKNKLNTINESQQTFVVLDQDLFIKKMFLDP